MGCMECARLLVEYEVLDGQYASAVNSLAARRETASAPEFTKLRVAADEARLDAELARLELERHQRVHRKAN